MRVLFVNAQDIAGGAEAVCLSLAESCLHRGHTVEVAVGMKSSNLPYVRQISSVRSDSIGDRLSRGIGKYSGQVRGAARLQRYVDNIRAPRRTWRRSRGIEEFDYPESRNALLQSRSRWDLVHLHNLHGGYFDLRMLPELSRSIPVLATLHDAWLLSGHCAHSLGCNRWETGCGQCPDLGIYPPIERDATAGNWKRKRRIFAQSEMYVATPSEWLRRRVERSMLLPGIREMRVIPNGIDLDVFRPADRLASRAAAQIPQDADVLMFAANGLRWNRFKDYSTLLSALNQLAAARARPIVCLAVGDTAPPIVQDMLHIKFVPFVNEPAQMAALYNTADVYVHPARDDTFPTSILEAMACGLPVVASNVGGIPEQVADGVTGLLCSPGDPAGLSGQIERMLSHSELRKALGSAGYDSAIRNFDKRLCADRYLQWYTDIVDNGRRVA